MDLGDNFGSDVGNEFELMLRQKRPHPPENVHDIVHIHSLMIFTNPIEYKFVGDTTAPLVRCFPLISELKAWDIINTGEYMNFQTFSNLQLKSLLEKSFHSFSVTCQTRAVKNCASYLYHSSSFDVLKDREHSFLA